MGIEGGEGGRIGRRIEIEGEMLEPIREIFIQDATHIPLPKEISWGKGGRLIFRKVDQTYSYRKYGVSNTISLYEAIYEFSSSEKGKPQQVNLTATTNSRPCYFTGTIGSFYAHDPRMNGKEDNFYVVGVDSHRLEESQKNILAVGHELGHALIMDDDGDLKLLQSAVTLNLRDLPQYTGILKYGNDLLRFFPESLRKSKTKFDRKLMFDLMGADRKIDKSMRLFHERFAWAAGLLLLRGRSLPSGCENPGSILKYVNYCLDSYANYYGDRRFSKGLRN